MISVFKHKHGLQVQTSRGRRDFVQPQGYEKYPGGDAAVTKEALKLCRESNDEVYAVQGLSGRYWRVRYYLLPQGVAAQARAHINAKRGDPVAWRTKRAEERQRRQNRDIERFYQQVMKAFPHCPEREARSIAERACEVGSGRVGRSRTAEAPVTLAVIAHIRHNYTEYDELLNEFENSGFQEFFDDEYGDPRAAARREARREVSHQIDRVLCRWRYGEEAVEEGKCLCEADIRAKSPQDLADQ